MTTSKTNQLSTNLHKVLDELIATPRVRAGKREKPIDIALAENLGSIKEALAKGNTLKALALSVYEASDRTTSPTTIYRKIVALVGKRPRTKRRRVPTAASNTRSIPPTSERPSPSNSTTSATRDVHVTSRANERL